MLNPALCIKMFMPSHDRSGHVYVSRSGHVYVSRSGHVYVSRGGHVYVSRSGHVYVSRGYRSCLCFYEFPAGF